MDQRTGVSPGLKVMVDRATRWKIAWQQSPLAACAQEVEDGIEDGTKDKPSHRDRLERTRVRRRAAGYEGWSILVAGAYFRCIRQTNPSGHAGSSLT
jgi:hypothetical protein